MTRVIFVGLVLFCYTDSSSQCVPGFPIQKGWLGGDNAISVQLNNNRVAWFFSDSFVGKPSQIFRDKAKIIANSVAISGCENGTFNINYYWKRDGTSHPSAFFPNPNSKFKYWPAYAFVHDQKLFVILSLIGPKPGSQENDLFNFKHYGVVLAVISNFESEPDQWRISQKPWTTVVPHEWTGAVLHEGHLYVLRSSPNHEVALIRVGLESLIDPIGKIEYWAKDRTWKQGFDDANASILFKEYINGSLNYNIHLKKWILIYGPSFLSNTIHYRVADTITGTWTDPIPLFKAPEATPGNKQFDSTYFCYCAREQPTFNKGSEICVTYDCNSSDSSKLVSDLNIYFPRVRYISIQ